LFHTGTGLQFLSVHKFDVYIYTYTYINTYIYLRLPKRYICKYTLLYIPKSIFKALCFILVQAAFNTYTYIRINTYIYTFNTYTYIRINTHIYTFNTYTYIRINTCTYIYLKAFSKHFVSY
jgi:hypothetical protein